MTHNEAPESMYMSFAVGDKQSDAAYIRSDIAEARVKDAVQKFANELTYELDKIEGRFLRADIERVHDLITQQLKDYK